MVSRVLSPILYFLPLTAFSIGQWKADVPIPIDSSLAQSEENLEGDEKQEFLRFVGGMLQWRPEDRKTAKELLQDPWLYN